MNKSKARCVYNVKNALRGKTGKEKIWDKRQFTWFRAIIVERNFVIRAVKDVVLSDIERSDQLGGSYLEFEYDMNRFRPDMSYMLYYKGVRYGLFMVGYVDQLQFPTDGSQKLDEDGDVSGEVPIIEMPELDAVTYCRRSRMNFLTELQRTSDAWETLVKNVQYLLYGVVGLGGCVGLVLLKIFEVL